MPFEGSFKAAYDSDLSVGECRFVRGFGGLIRRRIKCAQHIVIPLQFAHILTDERSIGLCNCILQLRDSAFENVARRLCQCLNGVKIMAHSRNKLV